MSFLYRFDQSAYSTVNTFTKKCRRCGAEFKTQSRVKKRCNDCQASVTQAKQPVYVERMKKRREGR